MMNIFPRCSPQEKVVGRQTRRTCRLQALHHNMIVTEIYIYIYIYTHTHTKEEALDRTMWRARFGRGFGPVVRQTAK